MKTGGFSSVSCGLGWGDQGARKMRKVGWSLPKHRHARKWPTITALLFLAWQALCPVPSECREAEPKEGTERGAIHITSDMVESDHRMRWIEFKGNVKATQEDVVITADRIKVFYELPGDTSGERPRVARIISQGNVSIVFENKNQTAAAEQAIYYADDKMLVLSGGGATLCSGENMIRGEKITLFQEENRTLVEGGDQKGQVEAILHPEVDEGVGK